MGEVYRARDTKLKREVASRSCRKNFRETPVRVSRFQSEAEVLASINHPNIAAIHDLKETDGARYLVLELVPFWIKVAARLAKVRQQEIV